MNSITSAIEFLHVALLRVRRYPWVEQTIRELDASLLSSIVCLPHNSDSDPKDPLQQPTK